MAVGVSNDPAMMKLLRLYGVRTVNAFAISAIVGDISRFRTPKQLVAYVGLQPKVTQSGNTKRTSVTIGFGRRDLRAYILQSAHAILRMGPNTHPVAKWGQQKARQKGWNVAAVAVARKLVVEIWYLMRGFYTNLEEVSPMIRLHLRKMGNTIGAKARREMGYRTVEDFVIQKELILLDTT